MPSDLIMYYCMNCRKDIFTNKVDDGWLPDFIECKATDGCGGAMQRSYESQLECRVTHEWYKPGRAEVDSLDHLLRSRVQNGGLLLRSVT